MEIIDTATTLVDTLEYTFSVNDNQKAVAGDIAVKIREKIVGKQKL